MTVHTAQIGKYRFVCGLFWQSLSRPREFIKEAAALAKKIDCDVMVIRKDHTAAQAGFAHTRDGARPNTYSLAATISQTLSQEGALYDGEVQPVHNWLGAFKLNDGMWAYFAVRDANFLPNGDFAGTKEEVVEHLLSDYAMGGWNVVIGDPELAEQGFHNFIAKSINNLISHKKNGELKLQKSLALRPVEKKIPWLKIIAPSLALIMLAVASMRWYHAKVAEEERQRAIEDAARQAQGKAPLLGIPHPWSTKPTPTVLVKACVDNLSNVNAGGWYLDRYFCTATQINSSWTRNESAVEFFKAQVPDALVEINGNRAARALPMQLPSGRDEALLGATLLLEPLISHLQLLGLSSNFMQKPAQPRIPAAPGNNQPPGEDWQTFTFVINAGGLPPTELARILDLPGVRIETLTYQGGAWIAEGVMYAK